MESGRRKSCRSKKNWFINGILFHLLKLYPFRDKNCWVFGCWEGNLYDDNSRYLFEYVNRYHPEITAIWLTASDKIVKQIKSKGYNACLFSSGEGRRIQLKAGVAFYTNGIDDFGDVCFIYGAKIVSLWHGIGIKNIYYAGQKRNWRFWKSRMINSWFSWTYRTFTISSSEESSLSLIDSLCVKRKGIIITGFPRNDVFMYQFKPSDVLTYSDADEYRYILYMPTYRGYPDRTIQSTIRALNTDMEFLSFLEKNKIRMLIKKHYLTVFDDFISSSAICIVKDDEFSSTQELLAIADLLITDYSSCITDFALTGRPSILYAPDYETYKEKVGIQKKWEPIYSEFGVNDIETLKKEIMEVFMEHKGIAYKTTRYLRPFYESDEIKGTCYCENICQFMLRQ